MRKVANCKMENSNRETMVDWCVLLTGYGESFFSKMSDEKLVEEYQKIMGSASAKMEEPIKGRK